MPRTLVVMRHAKAEQFGPTDFERPLASRGHRDATAAGAWLAGQGLSADAALVSAALRTRETWDGVATSAGWDLDAAFDEGLYHAGSESTLDLIRYGPSDPTCLVVVGHNPTMASLAFALDDGDGDPAASSDLAGSGFPTSAMAVFEVDSAWADLTEGGARLVGFHVARG